MLIFFQKWSGFSTSYFESDRRCCWFNVIFWINIVKRHCFKCPSWVFLLVAGIIIIFMTISTGLQNGFQNFAVICGIISINTSRTVTARCLWNLYWSCRCDASIKSKWRSRIMRKQGYLYLKGMCNNCVVLYADSTVDFVSQYGINKYLFALGNKAVQVCNAIATSLWIWVLFLWFDSALCMPCKIPYFKIIWSKLGMELF